MKGLPGASQAQRQSNHMVSSPGWGPGSDHFVPPHVRAKRVSFKKWVVEKCPKVSFLMGWQTAVPHQERNGMVKWPLEAV